MATRIVSTMRPVGVVINGRQHHSCGWRAQPIAGRSLGVGERLAALVTDELCLLARMHTNIACVGRPSGRTRQSRTQYLDWIHDHPPGRHVAMARNDALGTCGLFAINPHPGVVRGDQETHASEATVGPSGTRPVSRHGTVSAPVHRFSAPTSSAPHCLPGSRWGHTTCAVKPCT